MQHLALQRSDSGDYAATGPRARWQHSRYRKRNQVTSKAHPELGEAGASVLGRAGGEFGVKQLVQDELRRDAVFHAGAPHDRLVHARQRLLAVPIGRTSSMSKVNGHDGESKFQRDAVLDAGAP